MASALTGEDPRARLSFDLLPAAGLFVVVAGFYEHVQYLAQ